MKIVNIIVKPSDRTLKVLRKYIRNRKWITLYLQGKISKEALEGKNIILKLPF